MEKNFYKEKNKMKNMIIDYKNYMPGLLDKSMITSKLNLNEGFVSGVPEIGDTVSVIDKTNKDKKLKKEERDLPEDERPEIRKVLPEDVHEYLLSQKTFKILGTKKTPKGNWCVDIGCISKNTGEIYWFLFKRLKILEPPIEKRDGFINIELSEKIIKQLRLMKFDPIATFILELRYGVPENKVRKGYVNFFDIDKKTKGFVTSLRSDTVGDRVPVEETWTSNRRQGSTFLKTIRKIFTDDFLKILDKDWGKKLPNKGRDVVSMSENFTMNWRFLFETDITIQVLRGKEILRAYNYYDDLDLNRFDFSCANFTGGGKGQVLSNYNFYVNNPDNCGIATIFKQGKIYGRAALFDGEAQYNSGNYIKGNYYAMLNDIFSDQDRKYRAALQQWAKKEKIPFVGHNMKESLIIPYNTRVCNRYPPVDQVYVNVKENLLCNKRPVKVAGVKSNNFIPAYQLDVKNYKKRYNVE